MLKLNMMLSLALIGLCFTNPVFCLTDADSVEDLDLSIDHFSEYFTYEFVNGDTDELLLSLSPTFFDQFGKRCKYTATISSFFVLGNKKHEIISAISVKNQSSDSLKSMDFYVSGFKGKINVNFQYSVSFCNNQSEKNEKTTNLHFRIKDIGALKK